jgi:hypothetical protein
VLHYLPYNTLLRLEKEEPALALELHKLLSKLIADRYDRSKEQMSLLIDTIYTRPSKTAVRYDQIVMLSEPSSNARWR